METSGGASVRGSVDTGGGDFTGRDSITINLVYPPGPFHPPPNLVDLRSRYLGFLQEHTQRLDFRGLRIIETIEKASGLSLDDIYVPLKARPEGAGEGMWQRMAGRMWRGEEAISDEASEKLEVREIVEIEIETAINQSPAVVILGDPGSGKSTLLKFLALSLAGQQNGPLPILVPLNAYAEALDKGRISLHDFLPRYYTTRLGTLAGLDALFMAALAGGQAVVLLDGLDEVQADRAYLVGLVEDFVREHIPAPKKGVEHPPGNRAIVTSRFVGYRDAPLTDPRWTTYALADWNMESISRFVDRWTAAVETAMAGGALKPHVLAAANREKKDLLEAVTGNPGIERLAGNPLLLTLLALIKRQGVTLPHRRVELYELYLETLVRDWRTARTMDKKGVGPELEYLEAIGILAPLALWLRENNPRAGLIGETDLLDYLADYYRRAEEFTPAESRRAAGAFLKAVQQYTNLLLERGKGQYGFLHLTFEEYLAAKALAQMDPEEMLIQYRSRLVDPAWREPLLLGVEALGIVKQSPERAGELLESLLKEFGDGAAWHAAVLMAGEAFRDVEKAGIGAHAARKITAALVQTMQSAEVEAKDRQTAGRILGEIGWRPEDLDAFIEIPAGKFLYGDDQEPREIPYRYWIGKYPVTNHQYARFIEAGGYDSQKFWSADGWVWRTGAYESRASADSLKVLLAERPVEKRDRPFFWDDKEENNPIFPVLGVTWFEADAYCRWLSGRNLELEVPAGYVSRLPTQVEWERAARGRTGSDYPWGDVFEPHKASVAKKLHKGIGTAAVCTYPQGSSSEGVWDACGNIWEWTASWYDQPGESRVLRGGSWYRYPEFARCAIRNWSFPDYFDGYVGIRVVVSLAQLDSEY